MVDEEASEDVRLMMEHSRQCLTAAYLLHKGGCYSDAINRAYYCVFHCARALLLNDYGEVFKKHITLISRFREAYIKTGVFEKQFSTIIGNLYDERNGSDYDDRFFLDEESVGARISDAVLFRSRVCEHLGVDT